MCRWIMVPLGWGQVTQSLRVPVTWPQPKGGIDSFHSIHLLWSLEGIYDPTDWPKPMSHDHLHCPRSLPWQKKKYYYGNGSPLYVGTGMEMSVPSILCSLETFGFSSSLILLISTSSACWSKHSKSTIWRLLLYDISCINIRECMCMCITTPTFLQ